MGFESDEEYIEYLEALIDCLTDYQGMDDIKANFDEEYFNKGE